MVDREDLQLGIFQFCVAKKSAWIFSAILGFAPSPLLKSINQKPDVNVPFNPLQQAKIEILGIPGNTIETGSGAQSQDKIFQTKF